MKDYRTFISEQVDLTEKASNTLSFVTPEVGGASDKENTIASTRGWSCGGRACRYSMCDPKWLSLQNVHSSRRDGGTSYYSHCGIVVGGPSLENVFCCC